MIDDLAWQAAACSNMTQESFEQSKCIGKIKGANLIYVLLGTEFIQIERESLYTPDGNTSIF